LVTFLGEARKVTGRRATPGELEAPPKNNHKNITSRTIKLTP
jgi:hypothetical protein